MIKYLLPLFYFVGNLVAAQNNQNQLKFSHEAIDNKTYEVYVENPTKQIRSFKVTLRGKNFKTDDYTIKSDTISPETKRVIYTLKKEKKKNKMILGYTWLESVGSIHVRKILGHKYQLPYPKGEKYKVIQGYNEKFSHEGKAALDFAMPEGTAVHAMRAGQIFAMKLNGNNACEEKGCEMFSNYIKIVHYDGTVAVYKNLLPNGSNKKIGDYVNVGQRIGRSGFTGKAKEPNLHVEIQILSRDLTGYESKPFECIISPTGKSDVLNKGDEYISY